MSMICFSVDLVALLIYNVSPNLHSGFEFEHGVALQKRREARECQHRRAEKPDQIFDERRAPPTKDQRQRQPRKG